MKLSAAQIDQIPALSNTMNQAQIASHFGCSLRTVSYWARRWRQAGKKVKARRGRPAFKLTTK